MSTFLFLLAIDWIMTTAAAQKENGIQWFSSTQMNDLDFANDLVLLAHTQQMMQEKTNTVAETSKKLDLNIHQRKTKIFEFDTADSTLITLTKLPLEKMESFPYLGNTVDKRGSPVADVKTKIGKARTVFMKLKNVRASRDSSEKT